MIRRRLFSTLFAALGVALGGCNFGQPATPLPARTAVQQVAKSNYGVIWNFGKKPKDGLEPEAALVLDATTGSLYGTTLAGGTHSFGTAVRLAPDQKSSGNYAETILANFTNGPSGGNPLGDLILVYGKLYGTTSTGGDSACACGTLFELDPTKTSQIPQVLYTFGKYAGDGATPMAGLSYADVNGGELYGTTAYGGTGACQMKKEPVGCGTVFAFNLESGQESVVQSFGGYGTSGKNNGAYPLAGLLVLRPYHGCGSDYCLVGTTSQGGVHSCASIGLQGCGTLFLLEDESGTWVPIQYSFGNYPGDGVYPAGKVVHTGSASADTWAGTTEFGGTAGDGTVYVVTKGNSPSDVILHSFVPDNRRDGANPLGGLVLNSGGELFGTTNAGGLYGGGTAFKVKLCEPNPSCSYEIFENFSKSTGYYPDAGFLVGSDNKSLYGTTSGGGGGGHGVANIFHNEF